MAAAEMKSVRQIETGQRDAHQSALARIELFAAEAARAKAADVLYAVAKELKKSVGAYHKGNWGEAAIHAASAAEMDPNSGTAFHLLALSLDGLGQMAQAIRMYEKAYQLSPEDPDIALNIGLAAWKMDMLPVAERAFRIYIEARPDCPKGYTNLGCCLRDLGRTDEGIDIVRNAIYRLPEAHILWNALGSILGETSDFENAITFYKEALRISPETDRYWHNLGYALNHIGPITEAVECYSRAIELNQKNGGSVVDRVEMVHARGLCAASLGQLSHAWTDYEARNDQHFASAVVYASDAPKWAGEDLNGKKLLLIGEQGVGDEIMFAEMVPDLIDACGPNGKVMIACDHRLVPLLSRSFPAAHVAPQYNGKRGLRTVRVAPWATGELAADYYAPAGTPLCFMRKSVDTFGKRGAFLTPAPDQIAHWSARLAKLGTGLKIGICWRSGFMNTNRQKHYAAMVLWSKALTIPGIHLVNLQYGDCSAEIAEAREKYGLEINHFPELNLKDDLDGNAALCAALDIVVSAPTAGAALSAAVGTETWFLVGANGWPQLGTDHYPWYPKTKVLTSEKFADWPEITQKMRAALIERIG